GLAAAAVMLLAGTLTGPAWGHVDPTGCNNPAVGMIIATFRGDKTTPISTTETVSECETVCFQVTLRKRDLPSFCAFQGGTLTLTLPDGTATTLATGTDIPCIGGSPTPPERPPRHIHTSNRSQPAP